MKKNIISVNPYYLTAKVEDNECPLNWLAEYYREYPGKLVMLDSDLMEFLLNKSHVDEIKVSEYDGYVQTFTLTWNATDEYPETKVKISSYGRDEVYYDGEKYDFHNSNNYHVIEALKASDILVNDIKYADNYLNDEQFIYLSSKVKKNTR